MEAADAIPLASKSDEGRRAAGKSARAWLEYSAVPSGNEPLDRQCEPTSGYLEVSPPGSKGSAVLKFGDYACGHGSITTSAFF